VNTLNDENQILNQKEQQIEEYQNLLNRANKDIEKLSDSLDEKDEMEYYSGLPDPNIKDNFFRFLKEILNSKDSRKTANLSRTELGSLALSVRHYLDLSLKCNDILNLDIVGNYYTKKAEIILATSMSKKGFFPKLMVTKIKGTSSEPQGGEEEKTEKKSGFWPFGKKGN